MDYFSKYLKYKNKYISLKNNINLQKGAAGRGSGRGRGDGGRGDGGRGDAGRGRGDAGRGKVHTCKDCQNTFTNWHMFDTHIASHKKCKNCPLLKFTSSAEYKSHIEECNKQKQSFRHPMHAKPELIAQTLHNWITKQNNVQS